MKNKIVIVNQDSGYLMVDLANQYAKKGYSVIIIAGRVAERDVLLAKDIRHIKIKRYNRNSTLTRLISWLVAGIQIAFNVLFRFRKHEFLFVSNPPISAWSTLLVKREFSLLVYDVYPEALHEIGFAKRGTILYRFWAMMNRIIYRRAKRIITISESMVKTIQPYAPTKRIEVIPIWADSDYLKPIDRTKNLFLQKNQIEEKFVVLYAGNIGVTANAEKILDVVNYLKNDSNLQFIIIGEGSQKKQIEERISNEGLTNCRLLPFQDREMFPHALAAANLAIVSLADEAGGIAIPSKFYSLLFVGAPILGICKKNTALAELIDRHKVGQVFESGETEKMVTFIEHLSRNTEEQIEYSANSLSLSNQFTKNNIELFFTCEK